ncbi:MAG: permease [Anaerolineae bacterium]|nr:permease [Anaerolineae bacterium]
MEFDLTIFATRFLGIFIEATPFLLLGTLASGLIEAFVNKDDITRLVPRNPILATVMGGMLGFMFPVCECGVVPVTRRLYKKGLPLSTGITFLLAAPVMNPVVVASTYAAFGMGPVLYGRYLMTALVAISVGLIFTVQNRPQRILRPQAIFSPITGGSEASLPAVSERMELLPGLKKALLLAREEFFEMGRYLIFGSMLAAAMGTLALDKEIETLASNPVNSVFVMQASAFVLSVCSTVDAFLALAFANTFTTGSLLSFLVFGPMVDIKSTMMFLGVFRRRIVVYLIVLPFLLTALLSIAINLNMRF